MFMGKGMESGLFRPRSEIDPLSFILEKGKRLANQLIRYAVHRGLLG